MNWTLIATRHFPSKTANACRKRHARLMESRKADNPDGIYIEVLALTYCEFRESIWKDVAHRLGEKWQRVEAMVPSLSSLYPNWKSPVFHVSTDSQNNSAWKRV